MTSLDNDLINVAKHVLNREISGIKAIYDNLEPDDSFCKAIKLIRSIKGRVILTGMGKSGHIANKIAATMSSTGTPSFFIHPSEASHGDLGMITKDDLVILLSNSGETIELRDIIYFCKRFGIPMIGIVRRKTSLLVEASDIAIILPEIEEASKIAAPTTSTTMMLAIGDAIAITLSEISGFNKENFGIFHPGGSLGKDFLKVSHLMRKSERVPMLKKDALVKDAIMEISNKSLGCVAIVNDEQYIEGIITDGDIRRHLEQPNFLNLKVYEVMTKNPLMVNDNLLIVEAVKIMNDKKITNILVAKENKLLGILHLHDCLSS